ncbi:hypothetical protein AWB69_07729 [Caballeronia udeis]|uniref:Cytochrome c domain-containing protein n=1 Tax=Caballeronia udeis TaxID=1232866 RepID=A0A158JFF4_9BURK|nr:hypothetical protein AWB69_07729 [Caballeronia udeis]
MARALNRAAFTIHVMTALFLVVVKPAANGADSCRSMDLGYQLFNGQRALVAHLRDDNRMLPDIAARCINCHDHADNAASFAPPLTSRYLLSDTRRRGGPPSRYNLSSFCRVLNVGVDPTGIVLKKAMPQYALSDTECAALWSFVTAP